MTAQLDPTCIALIHVYNLGATALHDTLQALAELYHIQSPLTPEDDSLSNSTTTDFTDKEQRAVTPRGQLAAQPTAASSTSSELQSSFISRQELGMCSSADTPMTDGATVDTAVAATADQSGLQNTPASTSGMATDQSGQPPSFSRSHQITSTTSKPLCSQERQVHHVSLNSLLCVLGAVVALAQHMFCGKCTKPWGASAGHIACHEDVPETQQSESCRWDSR